MSFVEARLTPPGDKKTVFRGALKKALIRGAALCLASVLLLALALLAEAAQTPLSGAGVAGAPGERRHLIFGTGTPHELEVFLLQGRKKGPTVMIIGGIQGDEPGGFLCAELYTEVTLERGNLIVVPRANFRSVILNERDPGGDMNRKFTGDLPGDPEAAVVRVLQSLIAQSDVLLNLHDGSGFYRPVFESDMANPRRYGQCVIADSAVYTHEPDGRTVALKEPAEEVVRRVNEEISNPLYKFHFFNMETLRDDSRHLEQRRSATYYALTTFGIPAFGIESSKQLPSLEMKVRQHALAVNAFLDIYGVRIERPGLRPRKARLGYLLLAVNDAPPIAVAPGQTLTLSKGDSLELVHIHASHEQGLSADIEGVGDLNDMRRPLKLERPTAIVVRRDSTVLGAIAVRFLPEEEQGRAPSLTGGNRPTSLTTAVPATLDMLPGTAVLAARDAASRTRQTPLAQAPPPEKDPAAQEGKVSAFLLEVDGKPVEVAPGGQLLLKRNAALTLVDLKVVGGALPQGVVMNLKGFVSPRNSARNSGEDRGERVDLACMLPAFSEGKKGEVYAINAERGKQILASCSIRIQPPPEQRREHNPRVTLRYGQTTRTLALGSRIAIPAGAQVELLDVAPPDGISTATLRYRLAGHPLPPRLPQTLTMRAIAINLAVFDGDTLLGKITWIPQ